MQNGNIKVLLVEDDVYMNRILFDLMTKMGLKVDSYLKAGDAIDSIINGKNRYDLIVLDYLFDFYDRANTGIELYDYLKKKMPHAKGVMVSAFADANVRRRAAQMGIAEFLDKPFPIADFTSVINKIISENHRKQINA